MCKTYYLPFDYCVIMRYETRRRIKQHFNIWISILSFSSSLPLSHSTLLAFPLFPFPYLYIFHLFLPFFIIFVFFPLFILFLFVSFSLFLFFYPLLFFFFRFFFFFFSFPCLILLSFSLFYPFLFFLFSILLYLKFSLYFFDHSLYHSFPLYFSIYILNLVRINNLVNHLFFTEETQPLTVSTDFLSWVLDSPKTTSVGDTRHEVLLCGIMDKAVNYVRQQQLY